MQVEAAYILALLFDVAAVVAFFALRAMNKDRVRLDNSRKNRLISEKSTYFLDTRKVDGKCDICFGDIGADRVAACQCGKTFHLSCAEMTAVCPYCEAPLREMETRDAMRPICPGCGKPFSGGVCSCGAVLPDRDGTFECVCGNKISIDDRSCKVCGAAYASEPKETA
jgi:hypothetical protein